MGVRLTEFNLKIHRIALGLSYASTGLCLGNHRLTLELILRIHRFVLELSQKIHGSALEPSLGIHRFALENIQVCASKSVGSCLCLAWLTIGPCLGLLKNP